MKRDNLYDRHCAMARAGAELVDGWTFVILREVLLDNRKFSGIQEQTGMNPLSLTKRLQYLVDVNVLEKRRYRQKPVRVEYCLTPKGRDLWPTLMCLKAWADRWSADWSEDAPPILLRHGADNHQFIGVLACAECGERVEPADIQAEISQEMIKDRQLMQKISNR